MYNPPKTLVDLVALAALFQEQFETTFNELHHFSMRPPFRTKPAGFAKFVAYCEGLTNGVLPGNENEQTIQRAYRFLELRKAGQSLTASKAQAWEEFPLVKTY